jgi:hypothetical protein
VDQHVAQAGTRREALGERLVEDVVVGEVGKGAAIVARRHIGGGGEDVAVGRDGQGDQRDEDSLGGEAGEGSRSKRSAVGSPTVPRSLSRAVMRSRRTMTTSGSSRAGVIAAR